MSSFVFCTYNFIHNFEKIWGFFVVTCGFSIEAISKLVSGKVQPLESFYSVLIQAKFNWI